MPPKKHQTTRQLEAIAKHCDEMRDREQQKEIERLGTLCTGHEMAIRELRQQISDMQEITAQNHKRFEELKEQKDNATVELCSIRARHSTQTCALERKISKLRQVIRTLADELLQTPDPEEMHDRESP